MAINHVTFQRIRLAGQYAPEEAQLAFFDGNLVAVLVCIDDKDVPPERHGWCLEIGFGPCRGEGILLPTLEFVEAWIRDRTGPN